MFFTFCMHSFVSFKGKLRYFASGICQQKFLSSKGTCPTGFLFLSLCLNRSSPLSVAPLILACPQMRHVLFPTVPYISQLLMDPLKLLLFLSIPHHSLNLADYLCTRRFSLYLYLSWLLPCLRLNHASSSSIYPRGWSLCTYTEE